MNELTLSFRVGPGEIRPVAHLLPRGGDPLVPASGRLAGLDQLQHLAGRVGRRLHLRRDAQRLSVLSGRQGHIRPTGQDLQGSGHADRGQLARRVAVAQL